jgi:hypothetical protein
VDATPGASPAQAPVGRRAGERWSDADHQILVDQLRAGLPLEDVAALLGRNVGGVLGRCHRLLPTGERVQPGSADVALRLHLAATPDYDWRAALRADAARRSAFYWDPAADAVLRRGWGETQRLVELTAQTGASEIEVATRLVQLGLAASTAEVASRLGAQPDGTLDVRVRMAADRSAAAVWVLVADGLVADGLRGSERARPLDHLDGSPAHRHISLHANPDGAREHLNMLLAGHLGRGGRGEEVAITLAERTVGELGIGQTHHERPPIA